jgi:prepilin-type N-terminal cleavage/methylation domain-containing protein
MKEKRRENKGFTLIEMLVVVAIIALLAAILVPTVGNALRSAKTTQAISGIRQSGTFLLAEAMENRGRLGIHIYGSSTGMRDYQLVGIVGRRMGIPDNQHQNVQLSRIVRTPAWYKPPTGSLTTWHVWGVNFEENAENGVFWVAEPVPGYPEKVHFLRISLVNNPTVYPLLGDSSDAAGAPHVRLSRINRDGRSFALRYNERGPIFTLDGAARMIGVEQMQTYSLRTGYQFSRSNPATNPTPIRAY